MPCKMAAFLLLKCFFSFAFALHNNYTNICLLPKFLESETGKYCGVLVSMGVKHYCVKNGMVQLSSEQCMGCCGWGPGFRPSGVPFWFWHG